MMPEIHPHFVFNLAASRKRLLKEQWEAVEWDEQAAQTRRLRPVAEQCQMDSTGQHTQQLLVGDHLHRPAESPVVSQKTTITLE